MGGYEIVDWYMPQGRILENFWSLWWKLFSGLGVKAVSLEVMSDLKSEGQA